MSMIVVKYNGKFIYGEFAIIRGSKGSMSKAVYVNDKTFMHAGVWHCYKEPQTYMSNPTEFDGIRLADTNCTALSIIKVAFVIPAKAGMTESLCIAKGSL